MQKTCKNQGCQRKFEKTSHSDLCSICSNAYKSAEVQTAKRLENQQRQQSARSHAKASNRDLNQIDIASPPHQPSTSQPNFNQNQTTMPHNMFSNNMPPYIMQSSMMHPTMMYPNMYPPTNTNNTGMFVPTPTQPTASMFAPTPPQPTASMFAPTPPQPTAGMFAPLGTNQLVCQFLSYVVIYITLHI